jgi:hypothetical protein
MRLLLWGRQQGCRGPVRSRLILTDGWRPWISLLVVCHALNVFSSDRHKAYAYVHHICTNRHSGCINGLFLDWPVRRVGLKVFWTLKWHRESDTHGPQTRAGGVRPEEWPEWMWGFKNY